MPRVGEHLSRERCGSLGRRDDGRRNLLVLIGLCAIVQQLGVAEHPREEVVEVVRDAARQDAQAVEPLRALDLLLEPAPLGLETLPLGDVADGADPYGPLAEPSLLRADLGPEARAVLADPGDDVFALETVAHVGEDARHVLRRDAHAQDVAAQELVALVAVHLAQPVVDLDDLAVQVDEKPLEGG